MYARLFVCVHVCVFSFAHANIYFTTCLFTIKI